VCVFVSAGWFCFLLFGFVALPCPPFVLGWTLVRAAILSVVTASRGLAPPSVVLSLFSAPVTFSYPVLSSALSLSLSLSLSLLSFGCHLSIVM